MLRFHLIALALTLFGELTFAQYETTKPFVYYFQHGKIGNLKVLEAKNGEINIHKKAAASFLGSSGENVNAFEESTLPFSGAQLFFSGYIALGALDHEDSKYEVMSLHVRGAKVSGDVKPSGFTSFEEISDEKLHAQLEKESLLSQMYIQGVVDKVKREFDNFNKSCPESGSIFDEERSKQMAIKIRLEELAISAVKKFYQQFVTESKELGIKEIVTKAGATGSFFFLENGVVHVHQTFLLTDYDDNDVKASVAF